MPRKNYKPAKKYKEGDEIPEGFVVAKNPKGELILKKAPKKGAQRKNHIRKKPGGGYYKTQKMMKNFYEGIGVPANNKGRPSKNGLFPTETNPGGAGKPLKYETPDKLNLAFSGALQRMATKEMIMTKTAFLVEMGMSAKTFGEYKARPGYGELCERIEDLCELYLQDQALGERNPNAIPMIKMYHDRAEKQSLEVSAKSPVDEMSESELRQLAETAVEKEVIDIDHE